jgi:hypothetical protein
MSYISVKMNHFTNKLTSPLLSVCAGYVYIAVLATVLAAMGMYNKSTFFRWGTPVTFMGVIIDDNTIYSSTSFFRSPVNQQLDQLSHISVDY